MVSRLFSSLSGMLSPPAEKDSLENGNQEEDEENDNKKIERVSTDAADNYIRTEIPVPIERKTSAKMSNFDLQFINAETMDRAIVNRLQSRMTTSVTDALEARPSSTGVKTRCERNESKILQEPRAPPNSRVLQESRSTHQSRVAQPSQSQSRVVQPSQSQSQVSQESRAQQRPRSPQPPRNLPESRLPQQSGPPQPSRNLKDSRPPQPSRNLQESRPSQPSRNLQESRPPQPSRNTQESRPPQPSRSSQESRPPQPSRSLQESRPQPARNLQESRPPQPARNLQESRPPEQSKSRVRIEKTEVQRERSNNRNVEESGEETEENEPEDYTSDAYSDDKLALVPTERSRSRHRPMATNESLSQSSVMFHDIPAITARKPSQTHQQSIASSGNERPRPMSADERRSIMYRNSQFSLENSSKEALCSESMKVIPEEESDTNSNALLHLPLFGIPDPASISRFILSPSKTKVFHTLHRIDRIPSAASSSMESLSASERQSNREQAMDRSKSGRFIKPSSPTSTSGRSYYLSRRLSVSQIDDRLFESSINDIIEKGGDEFKTKYSSWIWDAFRTQLVKLKTLMVQEFNEKLKYALEEREYEVLELQKRYQDKLVEFDTSTDNFQKLVDSMNKENQRMLSAKDFVIDKLKKEFLECKKHFEQDLQRQIQSFRKEAEVERTELQKRNDELMLIMLSDQSTRGLEEAFKNEIDSLHAMIKTLNARNELLTQQLEEATNSTTLLNRRTVENLEAHLNEASAELMDLRKKYFDTLQYADNEREDITVSHNQEIAQLNRKLQESSTRYEHQLRDAMDELTAARKKHSREMKDLKHKMSNQESQHKQLMAQVRQEYGKEVETLSQAVCQLRAELTLRGASARLAQSAINESKNLR